MAEGLPKDAQGLRHLKMMGFTDARLARLAGQTEAHVRKARLAKGVTAVFKRIDTCAAEFEAQTPYMYSTYEAPAMGDVECESRPSDAKKVVILGGGPNRIGQGIEFDYCCCHPWRPEPDRPGDRVRLLLLPCLLCADGGGL